MSGGYQKHPDLRALVALCCFISLSVQAETFSAKVIVVMDGDTVMLLRDREKLKVRLANIDAPEKDQPYGKQSRESLQEMVGKRQVQIDTQAVDQYGRIVGLISVDGRSVNQEQVKRGMAWDYSHFHTNRTYLGLQSGAQQARRGLWAQDNPQPPWQWRKLHPSVKPALQARQHGASREAAPVMMYDMECGKKLRCSQMNSCDEAHFYFMRCGVKTLDGNHDGIPCQNLCGENK
jgi:endonuclease YncB( thermonuclease family)